MINCSTCNAENESHYKFCLACGGEIKSEVVSESTPTAEESQEAANNDNGGLKDKLAEMRVRRESQAPALIPSVAPSAINSEPEEASFESIQTRHDQDATNVESLPSQMEGVVFGQSNDTASVLQTSDGNGVSPNIGGLDTVRLSEEIKSMPPVSEHDNEDRTSLDLDNPERTMEVSVVDNPCKKCGAMVQDGFRFCGSCGHPIEENNGDSVNEVLAELVFIHPSGEEGERIPIESADIILGRSSGLGILQSDPHLSPQHARFTFENKRLYCEDLNSFNGIFTRLSGETIVRHGGMFRIGQQLFMFELQSSRTPDYVTTSNQGIPFGSPINAIWGRLSSVCGPDLYTDQWILKTPEVYLGREQGTLTFPDDVFVSGTHCRLKFVDGLCKLEDLGSTNGTYVKRSGKFELAARDFILLGQQLFRIEYPT
ncbi:MAG: FHA domain-containing protein [Bradymonadia bacterium]